LLKRHHAVQHGDRIVTIDNCYVTSPYVYKQKLTRMDFHMNGNKLEDLPMLSGHSVTVSDKCQLECRTLLSQVFDTNDRTSVSTCHPVTSLSVENNICTQFCTPSVQRFCISQIWTLSKCS